MSKKLSFFIGICISMLLITPALFSKGKIGVPNYGNSFVKKICQKYNLKLYQRVVTGTKGKQYIFKEYRNPEKGIIVLFQTSPNKPEENYLNTISMYTTNQKKAMEIGKYFIRHLKVRGKNKKKWRKYLRKVKFSLRTRRYVEGNAMPYLRCMTKRHDRPGKKGSVFRFEVTVME